jgi:hypothetical protein
LSIFYLNSKRKLNQLIKLNQFFFPIRWFKTPIFHSDQLLTFSLSSLKVLTFASHLIFFKSVRFMYQLWQHSLKMKHQINVLKLKYTEEQLTFRKTVF